MTFVCSEDRDAEVCVVRESKHSCAKGEAELLKYKGVVLKLL